MRTKQTARRRGTIPPVNPVAHTVQGDLVKGNLVKIDEAGTPIGSVLEFIRLDYVRNPDGNWEYKPSAPPVTQSGDEYAKYSFSVVREWDWQGLSYTLIIDVKSPALKKLLESIMGEIEGLSWNEIPFKIHPQTLLTFYPKFVEHFTNRPEGQGDDGVAEQHLRILVKYLETEHGEKISKIQNLLEHEEITFDLMWSLLIPQTILYLQCPISREPRAVRLISSSLQSDMCGRYWTLECEHTEASGSRATEQIDDDEGRPMFGRVDFSTRIREFRGTVQIASLSVFPLIYHPEEEAITEKLIARGRKWVSMNGMHHKFYDGTAFSYLRDQPKVTVASRIMVDKATYKKMNPNDYMNEVTVFVERESPVPLINGFDIGASGDTSDTGVHGEMLGNEQLLLSTPLVYGFSLEDKMWLVFNVNLISEIQWQEDVFDNLVLPEAQKSLIQALVESHKGQKEEGGFDDFVVGKGRGLIINLFGPPGVGKTLSAEATSEFVRRPLYVVGVGEIGTNLEHKLKEIFDVASIWKAIVLIDEADVFMEQRSVHDLNRNALVAIFLRKLEYYQGILFLTTNRVKVFDEAFQSRIHISLRYHDLTPAAKRQIWTAFFKKASMNTDAITEEQWEKLSQAKINGRQIKNAVRSCQGLALSRQQPMSLAHVQEVLDVMEQFEIDFRAERKGMDFDEPSAKKQRLY